MLTYADVCYTGDDSVGTETGDLFCDVADEMLAEVPNFVFTTPVLKKKIRVAAAPRSTKSCRYPISLLY